MSRSPDHELERLMQDDEWLRRFVGTLVPAQDVDDVVQSTWLATLQGHGFARRMRNWMLGAASNDPDFTATREVFEAHAPAEDVRLISVW